MNQDIKPGDLCLVVRDCCGNYVGAPVVVDVVFLHTNIYCESCDWQPTTVTSFAHVRQPNSTLRYVPLSWLKKIPPLAELEGAEREVEVVA